MDVESEFRSCRSSTYKWYNAGTDSSLEWYSESGRRDITGVSDQTKLYLRHHYGPRVNYWFHELPRTPPRTAGTGHTDLVLKEGLVSDALVVIEGQELQLGAEQVCKQPPVAAESVDRIDSPSSTVSPVTVVL